MVILYRNEKSGNTGCKIKPKNAKKKQSSEKRKFHRRNTKPVFPTGKKRGVKVSCTKGKDLFQTKSRFRKRKYWDDRCKR